MAHEAITETEYASPADLARRYRVSKRTVLYWIDRGTITPAFRTGKIIRFIPGEVDRQLKENEGAAGERGEH